MFALLRRLTPSMAPRLCSGVPPLPRSRSPTFPQGSCRATRPRPARTALGGGPPSYVTTPAARRPPKAGEARFDFRRELYLPMKPGEAEAQREPRRLLRPTLPSSPERPSRVRVRSFVIRGRARRERGTGRTASRSRTPHGQRDLQQPGTSAPAGALLTLQREALAAGGRVVTA